MDSRLLRTFKDFLWALAFAGLFALVARAALGLGATTGLNDATPWGLWIAFKLCFVALAGGGFTLAALVYIFRLESYRPVLRRAILMALLGYSSFVISLLFDLGLPWHIYMPIIHWQHHSVMFEIAWCVMLYLSVLILEFSPVLLEYRWFQRPIFQKIAHFLHKATLPLVILGIALSTLHQSSLGALFLIMPHRVHPLWYTPWVPVLFFTSAIAAGMLALVVEGFLAERLFGRSPFMPLLERLGKNAALVMGLYLALRLGDLFSRGVLPGALDGSWQSLLFGIEILVGGVLPVGLLLWPRVRSTRAGLVTAALLGIGGIVSQRLSLSMLTLWRPESTPYQPSLYETVIAIAIPSAAGLVYFLFVQHLKVYGEEERPVQLERQRSEPAEWVPGRPGWQYQLYRRSAIAVVVLALMAAALPGWPEGDAPSGTAPAQAALGWDQMVIDGDRDGIAVRFPHLDHQERFTQDLGSRESACQACHHLNRPDADEGTACTACHQDNYAAHSIFDHNLHVAGHGGNPSCGECHQGEHRAVTAMTCDECHEGMVPGTGGLAFSYKAPGYQETMHARCQACHLEQAEIQDRPELAGCANCHFKAQQDAAQASVTFQTNP